MPFSEKKEEKKEKRPFGIKDYCKIYKIFTATDIENNLISRTVVSSETAAKCTTSHEESQSLDIQFSWH